MVHAHLIALFRLTLVFLLMLAGPISKSSQAPAIGQVLIWENNGYESIGVQVFLFDSTGESGLVRSIGGVNIGNNALLYAEIFDTNSEIPVNHAINGLSVGTSRSYLPGSPGYFILYKPDGNLSGHTIAGAHYRVEYVLQYPWGSETLVRRVVPRVMIPISFSEFGLRPPREIALRWNENPSSPIRTSLLLSAQIGDNLSQPGLLAHLRLLSAQLETTATIRFQYLEGHTLFGEPDDILHHRHDLTRYYYERSDVGSLHARWTSDATEQNGVEYSEQPPPLRNYPVSGNVKITYELPGYLPSSITLLQEANIHREIIFLLLPDENSLTPGPSPSSMPDPGIQLFQYAQRNTVLGRAKPAPKLLPKTGDVNRDGIIDAADMIPRDLP